MLHELNQLAYIDPGSGSFLLQALLAGVFGALYALKSFWGGLFKRKAADPSEALESGSAEERSAA